MEASFSLPPLLGQPSAQTAAPARYRIPRSTWHPQIPVWAVNKPILVLLNRMDAVSPEDQRQWSHHFARQQQSVFWTNAAVGLGVNKVTAHTGLEEYSSASAPKGRSLGAVPAAASLSSRSSSIVLLSARPQLHLYKVRWQLQHLIWSSQLCACGRAGGKGGAGPEQGDQREARAAGPESPPGASCGHRVSQRGQVGAHQPLPGAAPVRQRAQAGRDQAPRVAPHWGGPRHAGRSRCANEASDHGWRQGQTCWLSRQPRSGHLVGLTLPYWNAVTDCCHAAASAPMPDLAAPCCAPHAGCQLPPSPIGSCAWCLDAGILHLATPW